METLGVSPLSSNLVDLSQLPVHKLVCPNPNPEAQRWKSTHGDPVETHEEFKVKGEGILLLLL